MQLQINEDGLEVVSAHVPLFVKHVDLVNQTVQILFIREVEPVDDRSVDFDLDVQQHVHGCNVKQHDFGVVDAETIGEWERNLGCQGKSLEKGDKGVLHGEVDEVKNVDK